MHPHSYGQPPSRDPRDRPLPPQHRTSYDVDRERDRDRDRDYARDAYRDAAYRQRAPDPYTSRSRDWDAPPARPPADGPPSRTASRAGDMQRVSSGNSAAAGSTTGSSAQILSASRPAQESSAGSTSTSVMASRTAAAAAPAPPASAHNPFWDAIPAPASRPSEAQSRAPPRRSGSGSKDARSDAGSNSSRPGGGSVTGASSSSRDKGAPPTPSSAPATFSSRKQSLAAREGTLESSQSMEPGEIPDLRKMTNKYVGLMGEYTEARAEAKAANVAHQRLLRITPQSEAMAAKVKAADEERKAAESKRDRFEVRCADLLQRIVDLSAMERLGGVASGRDEGVSRFVRQAHDQVRQGLATSDKGKNKEPAAGATSASAAGDVEMAAPDGTRGQGEALPPGVGRRGEAPLSPGASRKRKAEALERVENLELEQEELRHYVDEQIDNMQQYVMVRLRSSRAEKRRDGATVTEGDTRDKSEAGVGADSATTTGAQGSTATQAVGTDTSDVIFTGVRPSSAVAVSTSSRAVAGAQTMAAPTVTEPATPAPSAPSAEVQTLHREVQELRSALAAQGVQFQILMANLASREAGLTQRSTEMDRQINALAKQALVDRKFIGGIVSLLGNVPEPPVVGPSNRLVPAPQANNSSAPAQINGAASSNAVTAIAANGRGPTTTTSTQPPAPSTSHGTSNSVVNNHNGTRIPSGATSGSNGAARNGA